MDGFDEDWCNQKLFRHRILCPYEYSKNKPVVNYEPDCSDTKTEEGREKCFIPSYKPVIYLYPKTSTNINIKIDINGALEATYPKYNIENGWRVIAEPDGRLTDSFGKEYSYLFWEGVFNPDVKFDMSKGFVVKGSDTREFLEQKLAEIGLIPKEYNEFIVYWYPLMQNNDYNLISFIGEDYSENAKLDILPKPDSILRIFMAYKALDKPIDIEPQSFNEFKRDGFTVIEWGGTEIY